MKTSFLKILFFIIVLSVLANASKDYTKNEEVRSFINDLASKSSYTKVQLNKLFSSVQTQEISLKYYKVKKEKKKKKKRNGSWDRYEKLFLSKERIKLGAKFMKRNKILLNKAYKQFGVSPEYITAIIGVETYYGKHRGNFPVFDSLVTLAFEKNRRNKFFKSELEHFLLITRENKLDPRRLNGSYAGAFGLSQFMPSSFNSTAIDFDKDGKIDLHKEADAIGSIANYFKKSGWNKNIPTATRVSYKGMRFDRFNTGYRYKYNRSQLRGIKPKSKNFFYNKKVHLIKLDRQNYDELWYGTRNFYVITRYNRSNYYAMAVHQLAKKIKQKYRRL